MCTIIYLLNIYNDYIWYLIKCWNIVHNERNAVCGKETSFNCLADIKTTNTVEVEL